MVTATQQISKGLIASIIWKLPTFRADRVFDDSTAGGEFDVLETLATGKHCTLKYCHERQSKIPLA